MVASDVSLVLNVNYASLQNCEEPDRVDHRLPLAPQTDEIVFRRDIWATTCRFPSTPLFCLI